VGGGGEERREGKERGRGVEGKERDVGGVEVGGEPKAAASWPGRAF
jgi:hypothetical protein